MSTDATGLDPVIAAYLRQFALQNESEPLTALREETAALEQSQMQISVEQGQFMALLARILGVTRALEVGVFTGYSALYVAQELPRHGKLVACDISKEWTSIAQRYWQQAGVENLIELKLGPAATTLDSMLHSNEANTYDFAFIDADKDSYDIYYEQCLALLRPGGIMTIDNIFMAGDVPNPEIQTEAIKTVRNLTAKIAQDRRVVSSLLPIGDGLLLVQKNRNGKIPAGS